MHPVSWAIILSVVNIPVYALMGAIFFRSLDEFRSTLRFRSTPGFACLFRGESWKDWRAELKLAAFIIACTATVYAEYLGIQALGRR